MSNSLTVKLVRGSNGSIDQDASLLAFQAAMEQHIVETETEESAIADAVSAQFDKYPGASQNMPALVNGALTYLNVTPATFTSLSEKVAQYVRDNADHGAVKAKDGSITTPAEAPRTRLFRIAKGVGGGVSRWSDIPEKA